MTRHVVGGFRGQKDDGSLQVRPPSQPSRGDVRQPALHQWLQGLGADERRVHDAPAKSTHSTGLWVGLTKRKGRAHVFEVLNQKENYEVVEGEPQAAPPVLLLKVIMKTSVALLTYCPSQLLGKPRGFILNREHAHCSLA